MYRKPAATVHGGRNSGDGNGSDACDSNATATGSVDSGRHAPEAALLKRAGMAWGNPFALLLSPTTSCPHPTQHLSAFPLYPTADPTPSFPAGEQSTIHAPHPQPTPNSRPTVTQPSTNRHGTVPSHGPKPLQPSRNRPLTRPKTIT